ncbi:MAG: hypothetical protein MH204_01090 [Fimbriimonadaceae bacterium]|nr:hypothetical protein [Fimbriimonadaceae bacterium]
MVTFRPSLDADALARHVSRQLQNVIPAEDHDEAGLRPSAAEALTRTYDSFKNIRKKYYQEDGNVLFHHLNTDHWAAFLYLLSNTVHRSGRDEALAARIFALNKALHGIDAFYGITLPQTFLFVHPVGTVLGNARYSDFFAVYQNCGVGATEGGYPVFGTGTVLYAKSAVLGPCAIGNNVVFAANSFCLDTDVPDDRVFLGAFPGHRIKPNELPTPERVFGW